MAPASKAPPKIGITNRGSAALRTWVDAVGAGALGHRGAVGGVDRACREPGVAGLLRGRPRRRASSRSASTTCSKNDRRRAIIAKAEPTPPLPTTRILMLLSCPGFGTRPTPPAATPAAASAAGSAGGRSSANGGRGSPSMAAAIRWPEPGVERHARAVAPGGVPEPVDPAAVREPIEGEGHLAAPRPLDRGAGELRVHLDHRPVEVVARRLEADRAEPLAAAEHHPAGVVEPPVPEQVAVVEAHAPRWGAPRRPGPVPSGSVAMMKEPIGSTRRRSDGHERVGVGVGGHEHVARVRRARAAW